MFSVLGLVDWPTETVREVVGGCTLVVCDCHGAISLVMPRLCVEWAVDWNLKVVCSQSVHVCVRVGENTTLKKIFLDTGNVFT